MKLHLDDIRIRNDSERGLFIDGCIYVSINDVYFPSDHWFDLVSVDLEHWIPDLISFSNEHTDIINFRFMDGPFQIRLSRSNDGAVRANLLEYQKLIMTANIDFSEFLRSVVKCLNKLGTVMYHSDQKKSYSLEIARLGVVTKVLRSFLEH